MAQKCHKQFGFYKNAEGEFLKMVDSLKLVTREQIQGVLQEAFKEINKYYSPQAYFTFAKWIGYPKGALVTEGSLIYYLTNKLMSRARTSLKRREGLPVFRTNTIFDSKGNDVGLATRL